MDSSIVIKKTRYHKICDIATVALLIIMTGCIIIKYGSLPDNIPIHYDMAGNVDKWGAKVYLWVLAVLAWVMAGLIFVVEKYPKSWNTGIEVTVYNRDKVYALLMNLLKTINLMIAFVFSVINIFSAMGKMPPQWFFPLYIVGIIGTVIGFLVKLFKIK